MNDKLLNILGIIAIIVVVVNVSILIMKADEVRAVLTGKASQGEVNVTIGQYTSLNFTIWQVNWGTGSVNAGEDNATLFSNKTVLRGNWSTSGHDIGLVIENTGNVNLSVGFQATETASSLIGGTNPSYNWMFVDNGGCDALYGGPTDVGSCAELHSGVSLNTWYDVNSSFGFCDKFQPNDAADEMTICFMLSIPSDSLTGARGDQITAVISANP